MIDALGNENQHGELNNNVGQDGGNNQDENSSGDWESQAKYFQSEKDKLYSENQDLKKYEKIGKFLEVVANHKLNVLLWIRMSLTLGKPIMTHHLNRTCLGNRKSR